jgi:alpha-beta hydrolase superfamily lysophospholipase
VEVALLLGWLWACAVPPAATGESGPATRTERTWVDPDRSTPALGDLAGADDRTLHTLVWEGGAAGCDRSQRPLLLLAHGIDGHPDKFDAFATAVAAGGVVIAAPAFPASNRDSGAGSLGVTDLEQQPGDLSVVLDGLLEARATPGDPLHHAFDPRAVVALGHSLGGASVLGWTRYDDPETRLVATALLSPAVPLAVVFGPAPRPEGPPTLLLHGLDDPLVSFPVSETLHEDLDDTVLVGLLDAEHSRALEDDSDPPHPARATAQALMSALLDGVTGVDAAALDRALDEALDQGHDVRR